MIKNAKWKTMESLEERLDIKIRALVKYKLRLEKLLEK